MAPPTLEYHRNEARRFHQLSNDAYRRFKLACRQGDTERAEADKQLMVHYSKLRDDSNKLAAFQIFHHFNRGLPNHKIDLHRLFVKEALDKLTERIGNVINDNVFILQVIVGKGLHSDGEAKIKPKVIEFAEKHNIYCEVDDSNTGLLHLHLDKHTIQGLIF